MTKPLAEHYDARFFDLQASGSYMSAICVLRELFKHLPHGAIVDIGCGVGTWLKAALDLGAMTIVGVDGSYVDRDKLLIDLQAFVSSDLELPLPDLRSRFLSGAPFDIVLCLEVAEHLSLARAVSFVRELTTLGDHILFSAAIPFQGGENHINEQWPEFWALLFRQAGFRMCDVLRPKVWGHPDVEWWYQQNVLLFVSERCTVLRDEAGLPMKTPGLVHPENYLSQVLTWFHRYRYSAEQEERKDLKSLVASFLSDSHVLPDLAAVMRAQAHPDSADVFPYTRSERFFPEVELAAKDRTIEELQAALASTQAAVSEGANTVGTKRKTRRSLRRTGYQSRIYADLLWQISFLTSLRMQLERENLRLDQDLNSLRAEQAAWKASNEELDARSALLLRDSALQNENHRQTKLKLAEVENEVEQLSSEYQLLQRDHASLLERLEMSERKGNEAASEIRELKAEQEIRLVQDQHQAQQKAGLERLRRQQQGGVERQIVAIQAEIRDAADRFEQMRATNYDLHKQLGELRVWTSRSQRASLDYSLNLKSEIAGPVIKRPAGAVQWQVSTTEVEDTGGASQPADRANNPIGRLIEGFWRLF